MKDSIETFAKRNINNDHSIDAIEPKSHLPNALDSVDDVAITFEIFYNKFPYVAWLRRAIFQCRTIILAERREVRAPFAAFTDFHRFNSSNEIICRNIFS